MRLTATPRGRSASCRVCPLSRPGRKLSQIVVTFYDKFYDDLWRFMSMERRDGNYHKMSQIVVQNVVTLSWRLLTIVVTFFFLPSPSRRPLLVLADAGSTDSRSVQSCSRQRVVQACCVYHTQAQTARPWTAPKASHLKASHPRFPHCRHFPAFLPSAFSESKILPRFPRTRAADFPQTPISVGGGRGDNPHFPRFRVGRSELLKSDRPYLDRL